MEMPALCLQEESLPFEHAISAVFQPIVRVTGLDADTVAVEALARGPRDSDLSQPLAMFHVARSRGVVEHLDRVCIAKELAAAAALPVPLSIFLNVHPQTLHNDPGFPAFLIGTAMRHQIEPSRLTIEVLEHARLEHARDSAVHRALALLRGLGVRIAVDDVAGAADALRACALKPNFLKLDAVLLRDARHSLWTREVLQTVVQDAECSGAAVIAEGVETERDMTLALDSGITLMQGFLLGDPQVPEAFASH